MENKFSKKLIYHRLINNLLIVIFLFAWMFFEFSTSENDEFIFNKQILFITLGISIGLYAIFTIYNILYYKTSSYSLTDKEVVCTRGVIFKKKSILEYSKIHAINKRQGLLQQIFHIGTLFIDSGSTNTAFSAEIMIIEDVNIIDELMKQIALKQGNKEEINSSNNIYNFSIKKKTAYSLLASLSVIFMICVIFIGVFLVIYFTYDYIKDNNLTLMEMTLKVIYSFLSIAGFVLVFNIIFTFINFYKFGIYKDNNNITINYGLLMKNHNTFKTNRIKAIIVKSSLIKRLFSLVSIDIEVIGYGGDDDKSKRNTVLIPLCKKDEVEKYISLIADDFTALEKNNKSKAFFPFVSWKLIFSFIPYLSVLLVSFFISLFLNNYFILLIVGLSLLGILIVHLIVLFISAILQYRFEGIGINEDKVTIYHGGIFQSKTTILKKHIIGIENITTPRREKKNIYSFIIHFRTNSLTNKIKVENVDKSIKNNLLNLLIR